MNTHQLLNDAEHKAGLLRTLDALEQNQHDLRKEGDSDANPEAYGAVAEFIREDRHLRERFWEALSEAERGAFDIAVEEFQENPDLYNED